MKKITMFIQKRCPYCRSALKLHEQLFASHPEFRDLELEIVDELDSPQRADSYDYYYVPTYYVDEKKLHEGAAGEKDVLAVFEAAYRS